MALEEARRDLQQRLEEVLGKEHARTLMAALPPTEAATKADVDGLGTALRADVDGLGTALREEMRGEFESVRAEMRAMEGRVNERIDLKVETSEHRLTAEIHDLRSEMHQELGALRKDMVSQTRVFLFSTLTAVIAVGGLPFVTGRLG